MLQIIPSPNDHVIVVKATGLLSDEDYREFVPKIEELINRQGRVCLLVEFENFKGWELKALWADFKLGLEHPDDFRKITIVGEKAWHHLFAVMVRAFSGAEVSYSDHDQIKEADLIVTGSHGRKGIARLLDSTANSIMHSARCDVLVVKID